MMASPLRGPECVSDLAFDRLVAGELAATTEGKIFEHVQTCDRCRTRLDEIRADQRAFADKKLDLLRPTRRGHRHTIGFALASALAAVCCLLLFVRSRGRTMEQVLERTKGGATLSFYVMRDGDILPGSEALPVHPGDAVQFVFTVDRPGYLGILSVDGAGKASIYYPAGAKAAPFAAGHTRPVPVSTVLDGTLGEEHIYSLFCDTAVELEPIRATLARQGGPPGVPQCSVQVLRLQKDRP